jgi:hypothetical protein
LRLARGHLQLGLDHPVDQPDRALPTSGPLPQATEGGDLTGPVELQVIQDQHPFAVQLRLVQAMDDQGGVEPPLQLFGLVVVWVVQMVPASGSLNRYSNLCPGWTGFWTSAVPSMSAGTRRPCQWMLVGWGSWLVNRTTRVSPTWASIVGPGTTPLNP